MPEGFFTHLEPQRPVGYRFCTQQDSWNDRFGATIVVEFSVGSQRHRTYWTLYWKIAHIFFAQKFFCFFKFPYSASSSEISQLK